VNTSSDPWGRVDADGTVYVRTADGERAVGSWQAGDAAEALAFFKRKYSALATEVDLLEQRIKTTDLSPAHAEDAIERLLASVTDPHAVGDLDSLRSRVEGLRDLVSHRRDERRAERAHAREEALAVKERIVAEAERIAAEATHWKNSGERLRHLLDEWKAAPRADRAAETALWKRLSAARNAFAKRRKAYFADLEAERETTRIRKEKLTAEAESLASSTDWGPTASAFRELMQSWKSAGRAARDVEDELWGRFKAAQDTFFAARSAAFTERDAHLREHAQAKRKLLEEAERLLPVKDFRAARTALRSIQERWEAVGAVPRDSRDQLESSLRRVADAVRKAGDDQWRRTNPEAVARAETTVTQLRAVISQLESRLQRAHEKGDEKGARQAEEALDARRAWLAEAERTLAEFSG
jgi:polyhydroxyalkanoate synthesis regulator phasin